jgi:hypothetical protein
MKTLRRLDKRRNESFGLKITEAANKAVNTWASSMKINKGPIHTPNHPLS